MNSDEIAAKLQHHITQLKAVQTILFELAISDSSVYAQRESELCGEVSKIITEIEINLTANERLMKEWYGNE